MASPNPGRGSESTPGEPAGGMVGPASQQHGRHSVVHEEDQLDWLEHLQRRPSHTRRLDMALIGLTVGGMLILYLTVHFARHLSGH